MVWLAERLFSFAKTLKVVFSFNSTKMDLETSSEIRCEEKTRGGLSYDMILADPVSEKPPAQTSPTAAQKRESVEQIEKKLAEAERRRKLMESSRVASLTDRWQRIREAAKKREEENSSFVATTLEAIEEKLVVTAANRDEYLNGIRAKISEHLVGVEKARKQSELVFADLQESVVKAIETKQINAEENRKENLEKLLQKLKEHGARANKCREGHSEAIKSLDQKIQEKLTLAEVNREVEMNRKLEVLKEHSIKVEEINQKKHEAEANLIEARVKKTEKYQQKLEKIDKEKENVRLEMNRKNAARFESVSENNKRKEEQIREKIITKMETAQKNRENQKEKLKKSMEEHDRRADLVRANKEKPSKEDQQETPSSG